MTFPNENVLVHMLFADSAEPRKASNVTRPFPILWVGSGDETRERQADDSSQNQGEWDNGVGLRGETQGGF